MTWIRPISIRPPYDFLSLFAYTLPAAVRSDPSTPLPTIPAPPSDHNLFLSTFQYEPTYGRRSMRSQISAPPMASGVYPTRPTAVGPPVMMQAPSVSPYAYGYGQYPTMAGYGTYQQPTGASASAYGAYQQQPATASAYPGYSSLANALMPYSQPYGAYGGYSNRAIASNPYI